MKTIHIKNLNVSISVDGTEIFVNGTIQNQYLIKQEKHKYGFMALHIKGKQYYTHKLVAEAYVQNTRPVSYKKVCHMDGNSLNNHYSNLAWGDSKLIRRLQEKYMSSFDRNPDRTNSKIPPEAIPSIVERLENGEKLNVIAKEYKTSDMSIFRIRKRYCKNKNVRVVYSNQDKDMVKRLLIKHKMKTVARITGIRYETILRWSKQWQFEVVNYEDI